MSKEVQLTIRLYDKSNPTSGRYYPITIQIGIGEVYLSVLNPNYSGDEQDGEPAELSAITLEAFDGQLKAFQYDFVEDDAPIRTLFMRAEQLTEVSSY